VALAAPLPRSLSPTLLVLSQEGGREGGKEGDSVPSKIALEDLEKELGEAAFFGGKEVTGESGEEELATG
jgi:hypothetical protein